MYISKKVPYEKIVAATKGEIQSIEWILEHYSPYMTAIATIECYGENGKTYYIVDDELMGRIKSKLIKRILNFNPVPYLKNDKENCLC